MITITCPTCNRQHTLPDTAVGRKAQCQSCGAQFQLQEEPPEGDIFEQQTIAGGAPPLAPRPAPAAAKTGPLAPPPSPSGIRPPPLPPRQPVPLHKGLLAMSAAFLGVIVGCLIGIAILLRGGETEAATNPAGSEGQEGTFAGIEIGSKGIKYFVVTLKRSGESYETWVVDRDTKNTSLGDVPPGQNEFVPSVINQTIQTVAQFAGIATSQHNIPKDNVLIVCGSGVFKSFENDAAATANARKVLEDRIQSATGRPIEFIDAQLEAGYAARAAIRASDRPNSVMIDIGNNEIKGAYFEGKRLDSIVLGDGTSTFTKRAASLGKRPFPVLAAETKPTKLNEPLRAVLSRNPAYRNLPKVQIFGGSAWVVSVCTRPDALEELRTSITIADIKRYDDLVCRPNQTMEGIRSQVLASIPSGPANQKADAELTKVSKAFTPESMVSAGKIMLALAEECQFANKSVVFFREGLYAWLYGFILTKTGWEK